MMLVPGCSDFPVSEKRLHIWGGLVASDAVFDTVNDGLNILPPPGCSITMWTVSVKTFDNIVVWQGRFRDRIAADEFMVLLDDGYVPSDYWNSPMPMWVPGLEKVPGLIYAAATIVFISDKFASSWTVPSDFNLSSNTFEAIGGGGGSRNAVRAGAGGGAYARLSNLSINIAIGNILNIQVGTAGSGSTAATKTTLSNNVSTVVLSAAPGGVVPAAPTIGSSVPGGLTANNIPAGSGYAGGNGGTYNSSSGGSSGGGGSAGPSGAGANGGANGGGNGGGGGGGANGGVAGTAGSGSGGGRGGDGITTGTGGSGAQSSAEALAGQDGGGGGGGFTFGTGNGATGGLDNSPPWASGSYGPSGGGGGSGVGGTTNLGGGSPFGGGAGGAVGTQTGGGGGLLVITYAPAVTGGAQAQVVS